MSSPRERVITDSKVLAAMSHPERRRLLDALGVDGPSTVSMLAERLGQAVGSISHHLKVLAAAELVEEAPELARDRREHWWRESDRHRRWSSSTFADDPTTAVIADAALSLELERHVEKVRAWNARRETDEGGWDDAAFSGDTWLRLTPAELREFSQEVVALFRRWSDREVPDDGQERDSVYVFAHGIPAQP
jgi:DNA-binding transcriptional ArsR family regulator